MLLGMDECKSFSLCTYNLFKGLTIIHLGYQFLGDYDDAGVCSDPALLCR
jgi:hypothetical protein